VVTGVQAKSAQGSSEIRAGLTIAEMAAIPSFVKSRLESSISARPWMSSWMRISRAESDPSITLGRIDAGKFLVAQPPHVLQCAFVIARAAMRSLRQRLAASPRILAELAPFLRDRVEEIADWEQIKLLTVVVDRLKRWCAQTACIRRRGPMRCRRWRRGHQSGDSGCGAAANILADHCASEPANDDELAGVKGAANFPTRATQRMQIAVQNNVIKRVLGSTHIKAPWISQSSSTAPLLQRIPRRLIEWVSA